MLWILDSGAINALHKDIYAPSAQYHVLLQVGWWFKFKFDWDKIAKTDSWWPLFWNKRWKMRVIFWLHDQTLHVMLKWDTKDTKAKHVVSYTATRNLVKFLALNNLPVQCQRFLLKLPSLLLSGSAAEMTALWLWTFSLTNSWENWIFHFIAENGNFVLQLGTSLASCWPLVLCSGVLIVGRRRIIFIFYQSVLCDTSYVLCSIMHSSSYLFSLSQSKFPITSGGSSFSSSVIAGFLWSKFLHPTLPQKCLKSPCTPIHPSYFPINQWNYFRNPHYRVVTKGIPLTTVVLYVEFIYRSSSFSSHLTWYPQTPLPPFPILLTQPHTGQLHV